MDCERARSSALMTTGLGMIEKEWLSAEVSISIHTIRAVLSFHCDATQRPHLLNPQYLCLVSFFYFNSLCLVHHRLIVYTCIPYLSI